MDNKRSIARIADVIRSAEAQIVCLQEVNCYLPWSTFVNQAKWLGDHLAMIPVFQKNYSLGFGGMGNAILSSFDVLSVSSHSLTSRGERRGLLEVYLETPDGPLIVFCTHLGLDAEERVVQAGEIAAIVRTPKGARVLCGDLNESSSGSAVSALMASTGFLDASPDGFLTYPSDVPAHRIDFVLYDPLVKIVSTRTIETTASDHLPVVVEIDISALQHSRGDTETSFGGSVIRPYIGARSTTLYRYSQSSVNGQTEPGGQLPLGFDGPEYRLRQHNVGAHTK